jgi:putative protein-disulfide isomerase
MDKPLLIYCYDAYCGWCYGFSPVIKKLEAAYSDKLDFEVLSGGMILPEKPVPLKVSAGYIAHAYKQVEEHTGIRFGKDYLWHIFHPDETDWYPNSEKPSVALCIFKTWYPEKAVAFAADLQYALHFEGRDLTDDAAYFHLLEKYSIQPEIFYEKLSGDEFKEMAYYEFSLVKQLQVDGYPAVFIQTGETSFHMIARGYADYETLSVRLENVLKGT